MAVVARAKTGQRLEDEIAAVAALAAAPQAAAVRGLERALRERVAAVATRAAIVARERSFTELTPALVAAFERFQEDGSKRDPGCRAKEGAIEALDVLDANVPELFVAATRYFQREPQWGAPVDTAVGVRARAILALARWGDRDVPLLAGKLLVDPEWPVRQAAAEALGVYGERAPASALVVAMGRETEAEVITSCMQSLLRVAPDFALPELRAALSKDGDAHDCALFALAQSGRDDALDVLLAHIERDPSDGAIRALGLHRSERALTTLLRFVAEREPAIATTAATALGARRFDPGVHARAVAAAKTNGARAIMASIAEVFQDVGR